MRLKTDIIYKKDLGKGPLTLTITCCNCNALFEINRESIVMAIVMKTPFIEFFKFVQNGNCSNCGDINNTDGKD